MSLADVAIIILASGLSQRFGTRDKLLAPLNGQPMATFTANLVSGLDAGKAISVVPADNPHLASIYADAGIELVLNPSPEKGQGASLALGIAGIQGLPVAAALVLLADMPFVTPSHIQAVVAALDNHDAVASRYKGVILPPVLFARKTFGTLTRLTGDKGGRAVFENLSKTACVDMPERDATDIDTPQALARSSVN